MRPKLTGLLTFTPVVYFLLNMSAFLDALPTESVIRPNAFEISEIQE